MDIKLFRQCIFPVIKTLRDHLLTSNTQNYHTLTPHIIINVTLKRS